MSACQNCPRRTVEPNCHNAKTCPDWAKEEAEKEKRYAIRREEVESAMPKAKYIKSKNMYKPGVCAYARESGKRFNGEGAKKKYE